MDHIYQEFNKLNVVIDSKKIDAVNDMLVCFEVRGQHPLVFNSQYLGIHKCAFLENDSNALFEIFGVTADQIINHLQSIPAIREISGKVTSDPFNMFCIWLLHLSFIFIPDQKARHAFMLNISKYLHYRFFTSIVNYNFGLGVDEKTMVATVNNLSKKYDIVVYGTWKKVIEERCKDLISDQSIHIHYLKDGKPDNKIIYVLTDINTRIRARLYNVIGEFYMNRDRGTAISNRSSTTEYEGEKVLVHTSSIQDAMISNLTMEVINERTFVHKETVKYIIRSFPSVSESMLTDALVKIAMIADAQSHSKEQNLIKIQDGKPLYIGIKVLITNLIKNSYAYCKRNKIDISNRKEIFVKCLNIYSASRISDDDIAAVKDSIVHLVEIMGETKREATKSSLRLAIIMYILVRSFRFIK